MSSLPPGSPSRPDAPGPGAAPRQPPTFAEALRFWARLGLVSFGGPAGQIALMHAEIVVRRGWVSEQRFLHALNFCMLLPGPEAQQLAVYLGWLLHRTRGGVAAGVLFVLPSAVILWVLSWVYVAGGRQPGIAAVFSGLKPAVVAIVLAALLRIGARALRNEVGWAAAGSAFAAICFFHVPFPAIVLAAGLAGWLGGKWLPGRFPDVGPGPGGEPGPPVAAAPPRPRLAPALHTAALWVLLWAAPQVLLACWLGSGHTVVREGIFFSQAATVTFGGAYAVLPYVSQQAVDHYGWLGPDQMLDGLGLAETTPGPLIMVLQFVGFVGAWNHPDGLPRLVAATLGAFITTWTTFTPCFLWVLGGAPYLEQVRGHRRLAAALSAVTAAVVGVILNLAVWFGGQVLFPAGLGGPPDGFSVVLAVVAFTLLQRFRWEVIPVVLASAAVGWVWKGILGL